ncbi:hypothetical protein FHS01_001225 [Longimicrobium terrae]|uniref:Uncharacterized protein n=1 Tax=Longimicrobium terrae TaxID=1639882 RepID=A0A841GT20_9BACT|nr:hypothetical protein [Longimicrobium terrae]MBB6069609.1 hypothetical protein [Longimicrobium terrae]
MRKIKLKLEQLEVEAFATDAAGPANGTVHGREYTVGQDCATVQPGRGGCENSGVASCAWCPADTQTCQDCSWTNGDGAICYW